MTYKCTKCSDDNCHFCITNPDVCTQCKDNYEFDTSINSPYYNKCIKTDYEYKCSVENCEKCIYENPNECAKCIFGYEIDRNNKCEPEIKEQPRDTLIPEYKDLKANNGKCEFNISDYNTTVEAGHILTFKLDDTYADDNQKLELDFTHINNENFAFEINPGLSEITFKGKSGSNVNFDIVPKSAESDLTINLDGSIRPSIIDGDGSITIKGTDGTNTVNLNKVYPSSNNFKIIAKTPIVIETVNFNSKQSLLVDGQNNANVEIKALQVNQKAVATLTNAKISGLIEFGISASLEINQNVDLLNSKIELLYSGSQGLFDKAPINGIINSHPESITINYGKPKVLEVQERFLIAESSKDDSFCSEWRNRITNNVKDTKINSYECPVKENDFNGNEVYRLYAQQKIDPPKKKSLPPGAIAGIVIGVVVVVGIVIFLLVYFLVIKKKKENESPSEQEAGNEKNADEV